jgi:hypothetical protein
MQKNIKMGLNKSWGKVFFKTRGAPPASSNIFNV